MEGEKLRLGNRPGDGPAPEAPRLRVVISAYGLSPYRGSEAAIAWQHVSRLAIFHDVTALCTPGVHGEIREEYERFLRTSGPLPGLTIEFVDLPPLARFLERNSSSPLRAVFAVGNRAWQKAAYLRALELHQRHPFDAAHQMTITGFREPGYLWMLPVPFFWGPVAGASDIPWSYLGLFGWRDRLAYAARNSANWVQKRISIRPRRAARAASEIWAVGPDNTSLISDQWGYPSKHIFECCAVPPAADLVPKVFKVGEPLRLVTAGYHVGRKALPIALHALARVPSRIPWQYTVLGHGPEKSRWMQLGQQLGLGNRVRWLENLPHAEALREINDNHAMLFPSLKEGTSSVVPEALAFGLPVICHALCGMSIMVNQDCGILVPARGPDASAAGFAGAIERLATTPGELSRLSRGAIERAKQVTWDANAEMMAQAYVRHCPCK